MAETSDQTAVQRRATWVGLRTLRQRPKVVGETQNGDPIFEVKSVRLVLRDEAGHFSRLTQCSKCGREVPGAPVMSSADLDRPAHSVICKDCVRASVASRPLQPERRPAKATSPATAATPPPPGLAGEVHRPEPAKPVDDVRLAAMEVQLEAAVARLAELADVPRQESAEAALHEALRQGLAEIRAEVAASSGTGAGRAAVDDEARKNAETLAQVVQAQQGRLVALSAVIDEVRGELQRLAQSNLELARASADLERRLEEGRGKAGSEVTALEQRLRGDVTALTEQIQTLRGDLEGSIGAPVQTGMVMVIQAIQDLARARDDVKGSVADLLERARDADARIEALTSALDDESECLRDLELTVQMSIDRPAVSPASDRRELTVAEAADRGLDHGAGGTAGGELTGGELLDGLERQLQEAEGRLARLTARAGGRGMPPADGKRGRTA